MKMLPRLPCLCVIGFFLVAARASSASSVVASYLFINSSAASSDSDPSTAGNFTVSIASPNGGISVTSGNGGYLKANVAGAGITGTTAQKESAAITNGTYYSFTITPAAGTALQLTSLTFNLGGSANSQGNFIVSAFLRTSVDNFSANTGTITSGSYSVPNDGNAHFNSTGTNIDLSGLSSIAGTTTLEIYSYINTSNSGGVYARINNVMLNATTIPIPEPSTYALGLGAFTGLFAFSRRRKRL